MEVNRAPFLSLSLSLIWKCCPVLINCRRYTLVSLAAAGNTAVSCSSCFSSSSSGIFQGTKDLLYSFIETVRALNGKWILKVSKTKHTSRREFGLTDKWDFKVELAEHDCRWRSSLSKGRMFLENLLVSVCFDNLSRSQNVFPCFSIFFTVTNCIHFLIGLLRPPTWKWTSPAGNKFCAAYNLRTWIRAKRRWSYWIMSLWYVWHYF